ncbi:MAG: Eco57I restriction-modification methylase domain-containing protein [Opitutaceae bacterium]
MALATQLDILLPDTEAHDAMHYWADSTGDSRGEVFTKTEVVEFILDLSGWRMGQSLATKRLLEPSCGSGDFVIPALRRLLADAPNVSAHDLLPCIRAVEVSREAFAALQLRVRTELEAHHFSANDIDLLIETWLIHGDFLTRPFAERFSHVVGNPPYLRIEALPKPLMQRYRTLFRTMYDRADLYIAFYEKGLSLLQTEGRLGYICANRWTKNRYGGPLRELIANDFHMDAYIDFTGIDAFHGEVTAYPSVTIIRNGRGDITQVVDKEDVNCSALPELSEGLLTHSKDKRIKRASRFTDKREPWLLSNAAQLLVIQDLEHRFPTLEEAGCKVGIGVATGADKVFIGTDDELPIEATRKLPLLTRKDLKNNRIEWTGKYVLNPFDGDCPQLVDLNDYPRLGAYLQKHREQIQRRHVAKKSPNAWFKTIDRIYPSLTATPKLVIPDIQGEPQVAYDPGEYYPHHNLYYITSQTWNLQALQTVLRSSLANAFVATYSLRMRGDCLRFQAQYLRRIRLPQWNELSEETKAELIALATSEDTAKIDNSVRELYDLDAAAWHRLCSD